MGEAHPEQAVKGLEFGYISSEGKGDGEEATEGQRAESRCSPPSSSGYRTEVSKPESPGEKPGAGPALKAGPWGRLGLQVGCGS